MGRQSAGLLVYRRRQGDCEVLLVHPGGPFWQNKDAGAWSIPKGEFVDGENPLEVARREFFEETGQAVDGDFLPLQPVRQRGGKRVFAWLVEAVIDVSQFHSNTFAVEWPPGSGKYQEFPEVDRVEWFTIEAAMEKINERQRQWLQELAASCSEANQVKR